MQFRSTVSKIAIVSTLALVLAACGDDDVETTENEAVIVEPAEEPATEAAEPETPAAEAPEAEVPATAETPAEEPPAEEPTAEEPPAEEPPAEDTATTETPAAEPTDANMGVEELAGRWAPSAEQCDTESDGSPVVTFTDAGFSIGESQCQFGNVDSSTADAMEITANCSSDAAGQLEDEPLSVAKSDDDTIELTRAGQTETLVRCQ